MKMTSKYIAFFCLLCLLVSCKTQNLFQETTKEQKAHKMELDSAFFFNPDYQYIIRKDDKINISVWGQEDLSVGSVYGIYNSNEVYGKWLLVDASGNIEVPKIGTTKVEGKSVIELKDSLKNIFQEWIVRPIVDVKVLNKEITILGEVKTPGIIQVDKDRNTLLELIARAGGFDFYANIKYVKVLRQEGEHVRVANVDLSQAGGYLKKNLQLYPGDMVIVPSKSYKEFDKRISVIIPFTTTVSASAIILGLF
jgi:polysaccharide export outer membrane protein